MRVRDRMLYSDPMFDYEICDSFEQPKPGTKVNYYDICNSTQFLKRFLFDHNDKQTLRNILSETKRWIQLSYTDDDEVVQQLGQDILMGRLNVIQRDKSRTYGAWKSRPETQEPVVTEPPTPETQEPVVTVQPTRIGEPLDAWIAFKLVDEQNKPVGGIDYELILPDGRVETGTTDADGMVRYQDIRGGQCQLCFTGLDKDAWAWDHTTS